MSLRRCGFESGSDQVQRVLDAVQLGAGRQRAHDRAVGVRHEARADYFGAFMGSVLLGEVWQSCPKVTLVLAGHTHRRLTVQVGHMTALTSPVGYAQQWDGSTPYAVARDRLRVLDLTVKEGL